MGGSDPHMPLCIHRCLPRLVRLHIHVAALVVTDQIVSDITRKWHGQYVLFAGFEFLGRFDVHEFSLGNERHVIYRNDFSITVDYGYAFGVYVQIVRM